MTQSGRCSDERGVLLVTRNFGLLTLGLKMDDRRLGRRIKFFEIQGSLVRV